MDHNLSSNKNFFDHNKSLDKKKKKNRWSKLPSKTTLLLCLVAATLNLLLSEFVGKVLQFPLFLDTIFTIVILFLCGVLPAIFTTFIYSIPSSLLANAPFYILFNICGIAIILITYVIMKKGKRYEYSFIFTSLYLILAALIAAFVSSFIGGIIHSLGLLLFPTEVGEIVTERFVLSLFSINNNILISSIVGRLPITCIDRLISNFAAYGIYILILKYQHNKKIGGIGGKKL